MTLPVSEKGSVCHLETGRPICLSGLESNQPQSCRVVRGTQEEIKVVSKSTYDAWIWELSLIRKPDVQTLIGCEDSGEDLTGTSTQRL